MQTSNCGSIFANDALLHLAQYNLEEVPGCTPDALFQAEDLPFIKRQYEWNLRFGRHRYEFYLPREDGQKIPRGCNSLALEQSPPSPTDNRT